MKKIYPSIENYSNVSHNRKPALPCEVSSLQPVAQNACSPVARLVLDELRREITLIHNDDSDEKDLSRRELDTLINNIATKHGFELLYLEKDEILATIEKEQRPFGILQPLVENPSVTDIIISNFEKIGVQQGRTNYTTDLSFSSPESYEAFIERILNKAGTTYSTKKPITDGMIGGFARVHAVHKSLCDSGPYVTIRLNRFSSVSLDDLCMKGLAPKEVLKYLQAVVQGGYTLLIAGEVGTGKTTLARALASAISTSEALLVIEDTPEIKLGHPNVRYITTRDANTDGAGQVTPAECIRAGMRMAMNRIIFGEIRDAEAAEAFIDVCASGHPGVSTIHARSAIEAVARLQLFLGRAQRGVDAKILNEQIATAVHVIVHVGVCKETMKRRILEVKEIGPVADGVLRQRDIFRYQFQSDNPAWKLLNRVSAHREALETGTTKVVLSSLPSILELGLDVAYREVAGGYQ